MGTVSGEGEFNPGETCSISVLAKSGYTFTGWYDVYDVYIYGNPDYSFSVTKSMRLVAKFRVF